MYFIIEIFIRQNVDTSNVNTKKDFDIFALHIFLSCVLVYDYIYIFLCGIYQNILEVFSMKLILTILAVWIILVVLCAVVIPFALIHIFAGATGNGSPLAEKLATFCGIILCPLTLLAKLIKKLIRAISK